MAMLDDREQYIIQRYFGLDGKPAEIIGGDRLHYGDHTRANAPDPQPRAGKNPSTLWRCLTVIFSKLII